MFEPVAYIKERSAFSGFSWSMDWFIRASLILPYEGREYSSNACRRGIESWRDRSIVMLSCCGLASNRLELNFSIFLAGLACVA